MMRPVFAFVLGVLLTMPAEARTLLVRSGEHDGFSRLAIAGGNGTSWSLKPSAEGYELVFDAADIDFNLSRVFALIPRDRLAEISQVAGRSVLALSVSCDCHAVAFETPSGVVVVDIFDGPDPASPKPDLDADPGPKLNASLFPPTDPDVGQTTQTDFPPGSFATDVPASARRLAPDPVKVPDPHLPIYWKGVEMPSSGPLPNSAASSHADTPTSRDRRLAETEALLLHQLGRAASQGLVAVELPQPIAPSTPETDENGVADIDLQPDPTPNRAEQHLRYIAQTSIDRDVLPAAEQPPVTADGGACILQDRLDVAAWGNDQPAAMQISDRRSDLLGEFDKPVESAVESLARLYIYLGFGAEAAAVLGAFPSDAGDTELLRELARIMDDGNAGSDSMLADMTDCDTPAALWAVLSKPNLRRGENVNNGAVLRAFAGLPPHLRRALGAELAARFVEVGEDGVVRAVRDAIDRAPIESAETVAMIDAQIDLLQGNPDAADRALSAVFAENGPLQTEALILMVESRIDRGEPVDEALAASAAALAFEHREAPEGVRLLRAHALAIASGGGFSEAFGALDLWRGDHDEGVLDEVSTEVLGMLSRTLRDDMFLRGYFAESTRIASMDIATDLRLSLAQRLMGAGFAEDAEALADAGDTQSDALRLIRARAALAMQRPDKALDQLTGITSEEAMAARAEALSQTGDHAAAARMFDVMGRSKDAARASWLAGDWVRAASDGPDVIGQAIREFGLLGNGALRGERDAAADVSAIGAPGSGQLSQAQQALSGSVALRATIDALLAEPESSRSGDG